MRVGVTVSYQCVLKFQTKGVKFMANIALQLKLNSSALVNAGSHVLFNTTTYSDGNISYDSATGEINLPEAGRFIVN
jgi:hypothetical protein